MTEQEMTDFIDQNRDAFLKAAREAVMARIGESMKWALPDVVHQTVNKFMTEEIAPEVSKYLKEQKGPILEACKIATVELSNELAKKLMETAMKTLKEEYHTREVFKALFRY